MLTDPLPDLAGMPVGRIAASLPGATAVFREFKVNFCCQGDASLAAAAGQRGVSLPELEAALRSLPASEEGPRPIGTGELIDHILTRYHDVHRRELSELVDLAAKVEAVHDGHPRAPYGLADLLHRMRGELEVHMKKEELMIFPAMRRGYAVKVQAPIAQMRREHDDHGEHLRQLSLLTDGFSPPEEACRSWRRLYAGVAKLSDDLMEHVHLENNLLFPRFQVGAPS